MTAPTHSDRLSGLDRNVGPPESIENGAYDISSARRWIGKGCSDTSDR
ncbi:MAG: hypothetical protein IIC58_10300 [Proteobacteria bacterium]|nr:hypothetical protein [Pseudomonadota bacterium]